MGDPNRFEILASFIEAKISNKSIRIADVAAGKGQLSLALKRRGYKYITAFEPQPRNKLKGTKYSGVQLKACKFTNGDCFDIIIGMHTDQATDVILDEACKNKAVVVLVPCCALPSRWKFTVLDSGTRMIPSIRQDNNYHRWLDHLTVEAKNRSLVLKRAELPISGRNVVLYGRC